MADLPDNAPMLVAGRKLQDYLDTGNFPPDDSTIEKCFICHQEVVLSPVAIARLYEARRAKQRTIIEVVCMVCVMVHMPTIGAIEPTPKAIEQLDTEQGRQLYSELLRRTQK